MDTKLKKRIDQIKHDFVDAEIKHGNEIKKVKVELGSTREQMIANSKEMKEKDNALRKEIDQIKENAKILKDEFVNTEMLHKNETKIMKGDLKLMSEQINVHSKEIVEKDNTCLKEIDQTKENVTKLKGEFINAEVKHKNEMKKMKKELDSIKVEINRFPNAINVIRQEISAHRPGFYATLSPHTDFGHIQTIKFDKKITDVKNNYNTNTGVFTVPKDGLYHISCTMFSKGGQLHAEVMQNDQVIGRNFGISDYVSAAINVVISCKQGDSLFVRHMKGEGAENIHGSGYSAFSGFLIH